MLSKTICNWIALGLVGALAPAACVWGQGALPAAPVPVRQVRVALEGAPQDVLTYVADDSAPVSEYWIGVQLGELPTVAKTQLKLEHGLVVDDVLPDSPAAKAQFKQQDVLVRVGDQPLNEPADILKAVDAAKDKELTIVIVREGKELSLKVTPARRPKAATTETAKALDARLPLGELKEEIKSLEQLLEKLKTRAGNEPLGIWFARPGVVADNVRSLTTRRGEFPKNLTVRITKEGDKPTKIYVKRDDKEWEVAEDKLGELPEDIRQQVQPMLGQGPMSYRMMLAPRAVPAPPVAPPPVTAAVPATPVPAPQYARIQAYRVENKGEGLEGKVDLILKKLDQLERKSLEQLESEVKQLRKELDDLRGKSPLAK